MKGFPDLPPVWFAGMGVLAWVLAAILPIWSFELSIWIARMPMAAGIILILWSAIWFFRKKTPIEPNHRPTALIVEGPYQISRNPIYLGLLLILLGWALSLGGLSALVPVLAFPVIIANRFIRSEEAGLRTEFGAEAEDYINRTARWLLV